MIGKKTRLSTYLPDDRTFLLALDTFIPHGPDETLASIPDFLDSLGEGPDGIVIHSGLWQHMPERLWGKWPWIAKLTTNSRAMGSRRALVDSVEKALVMGATGVAVNIFVGAPEEKEQFEWINNISRQCCQYGMPLIIFASPFPETDGAAEVAYAARVGAELGADIVKTNFPGTREGMKQVVEQCPAPVIIENSPLPDDETGTLQTVRSCMEGGGAGVLFSRRVWAQQSPSRIAAEIRGIIHGGDKL